MSSALLCLSVFFVDLLLCLHLSGCLEEGLEALLKATGSNLLILKISHCPNLLTDRSLWLASCYCRALQAVTYRYACTPTSYTSPSTVSCTYLCFNASVRLQAAVCCRRTPSHVCDLNTNGVCTYCAPGVPQIQLARR